MSRQQGLDQRHQLHLYLENQDRQQQKQTTAICHVMKKCQKVYLKKRERNCSLDQRQRANKRTTYLTSDHPMSTMNELSSESSEEEQAEVEEMPQDRRVSRLPIIHLMPRSKVGSPAGSPKISPKDSPRGSPRNSPLLFRKLMMNRSINLQRRRFTLAHTPRQSPEIQ